MSQLPCLGKRKRGHSRLLSTPQTGSLIVMGQELSLALAINLSSCLCVAGRHSMPSTSFALGWSALPADLSAWAPLGSLFPGVVVSPSGQIRLEDTLHSGWCCNSAPCLSMGKPGLAKLFVWGFVSGISTPWSECAFTLVLQMSKATLWDYYLGIASVNLTCQNPFGEETPNGWILIGECQNKVWQSKNMPYVSFCHS